MIILVGLLAVILAGRAVVYRYQNWRIRRHQHRQAWAAARQEKRR
jgi:hypothetical protein